MSSVDVDFWQKHLQENGFQGEIRVSEPMSKSTYYRIGGPADLVLSPKSLEDLKVISSGLKKSSAETFIMGMGSNLLVSDDGFRGIVIRSKNLNLGFDWNGKDRVIIGSSVPVATVLRKAGDQGIMGLEFLTGVPGSIGGTLFMNAGTKLGEVKDRLVGGEAFSLQEGSLKSLQPPFGYEYRKNHFLGALDLVYSATFSVEAGDPAALKAQIQDLLKKRKESQPVDLPSCGSVFKNPRPQHAWQVVDQLGLRGHRIGGAQISPQHSNFIVNLGGAKAADVRALIELAKKQALEKLGITLEEEVRYLGRF